MGNTGPNVERSADQAHQAVDKVAQKAAVKVGPAIDRTAEAAHQTVDRMAGAAAPAAEWAADSADQVTRQQDEFVAKWVAQSADQVMRQRDEFVASCRGYVRERPLIAMAAAVVVGFLLGRIAR